MNQWWRCTDRIKITGFFGKCPEIKSVFVSDKDPNTFSFLFFSERSSEISWVIVTIKLTNPFIFAIECCRPKIFQTMNSVSSNKISLIYYRLAPSGCQTIRIRNFELVAKTQFLSSEIRAFLLFKMALTLITIFPYVPRSTKIFQILVFIRNWISECCCSLLLVPDFIWESWLRQKVFEISSN